MAGKLIIHAPNMNMGWAKFIIYINGKEISAINAGETAQIAIDTDCRLQVRIGTSLNILTRFNMISSPFPISSNKLTELEFTVSKSTYKCTPQVVRQVDFDSTKEDETIMQRIRKVFTDCKNGNISLPRGVHEFRALQEDIIELTPAMEQEIKEIDDELCRLFKQEIDKKKEPAANNDSHEHRMRCNVCGHIFCYTDEDLKKNTNNATMSAISAIGGLASALGGGTIFHTQYLAEQTDRHSDKVIDYSRCPSCHSNNISVIEVNTGRQANNSPSSTADELKKFKDLLDMGVITQEEFDAKKKQLLGL